MPNLGLFPFCPLGFCTSILSTFLRLIPMGSQASCCNSVLLIDLLRPAELRFCPDLIWIFWRSFVRWFDALRRVAPETRPLNGFFGGLNEASAISCSIDCVHRGIHDGARPDVSSLYGCGLAGSDLQLAPPEKSDSRYSKVRSAHRA